MSGIITSAKHAILNTTRGLDIDTFSTATALAEQAIRNVMWEFKTGEEHIAWLERQIPALREHYELPDPAGVQEVPQAKPYRIWSGGEVKAFINNLPEPVAAPGVQESGNG